VAARRNLATLPRKFSAEIKVASRVRKSAATITSSTTVISISLVDLGVWGRTVNRAQANRQLPRSTESQKGHHKHKPSQGRLAVRASQRSEIADRPKIGFAWSASAIAEALRPLLTTFSTAPSLSAPIEVAHQAALPVLSTGRASIGC
jgi:hypothetical protein